MCGYENSDWRDSLAAQCQQKTNFSQHHIENLKDCIINEYAIDQSPENKTNTTTQRFFFNLVPRQVYNRFCYKKFMLI